MLLPLTLVLSLSLLTGDDAEPVYEWKTPEAAEQFAAAKASFDAEEYKAAGQAFGDLRKQAKGKKTKTMVKRYLRGCEGGVKLNVFRDRVAQGGKHKAYLDAEASAPKYQGTPVFAAYQKFLGETRDELFKVLEDFDRTTRRFSEKNGKTHIDDPKWVKQGKQSLKWEAKGKNISLKVKPSQMPKDIKEYQGVSVWVGFPKRGASYTLAFGCKGTSTNKAAKSKLWNNAMFKTLQPHKGWKRIEVPFKSFSQQGKASWDTVEDFRIEFQPGTKVTVYIDDIALLKK